MSSVRSDIGRKIPGSRYVRDYCIGCGEAIRVVRVGANFCDGCFGLGQTIPYAKKSRTFRGEKQYHGGSWK